MPILKLQSSDGEIFEVDTEIAKCSVTIKTVLEDLGMDNLEEKVVPLPTVKSAILRKILQWATYHKVDPPLTPEVYQNKEKKTEWEADFLKVETSVLFDIMLAAHYLDIKDLLDATCSTVGNMIKGKSTEEMRKILHIENDFTPSEEERMRKEMEWAKDF